ncbi:MAG TPA: HAD family hydrolase [Methanomicrobia archaeon]|nr:HAD family hydrolase [Methanomicrobia archaeon]
MGGERGEFAVSHDKSWYQQTVEQVFEQLAANPEGLTAAEAQARLQQYGYNELPIKKRSSFTKFILQFHNSLIYVLLAAALTTTFLDMLMDTVVILAVVFANTIIGFIQEKKADAAAEALRKLMSLECRVIRGRREMRIPARELVPGDIVLLEEGDKVPADLRLFRSKNLYADEATLTGESVPVSKTTEPIARPGLPPADQRCMAFSSTFITRGSGRGIVVGTGKDAEIGRIAELTQETEELATPLTRKMAHFTRLLVITILTIAALNFILAVIFGFPPVYSFLASVSLAVAAIPEGLPAILTITLAFGAMTMARRHALVKNLPAAETLGVTTVICSDKTGTLTRNQMTVSRIYAGGGRFSVTGSGYEPKGEFLCEDCTIEPKKGHDELRETLKAGYLCNNAGLEYDRETKRYSIIGDPTEGALVVSARKAGLATERAKLDEIPFSSEQQYMATLQEGTDGNHIYVKGAPERILAMCENQLIEDRERPLRRDEIARAAEEFAGNALRVLGMAYKRVPREKKVLEPQDVTGLTFLGLQGMSDPPRDEVIDAVAACKRAGIRVVMITGDHAQTAKAIAQQIGIATESDRVLTGAELERISDDELFELVGSVSIYARAAPEHKFRITRQLQLLGHITAVTGDGVNDAPALKAADIGIAMGISGTEVSKGAADIILTDDNFASIVAAVEEGRYVYDNIRKVILYLLPTNGGQALLILGAILLAPFIAIFNPHLGGGLPIAPVQILWINLLAAIALALPIIKEPKEKGLLLRPPRDPKERITDPPFLRKVGVVSLFTTLTGFFMYFFAINSWVGDPEVLMKAQTAVFTTVMIVHICYLFTARSISESAFSFSPVSNKWVLIGVALTLFLQFTVIYAPPVIGINPLGTAPLPAEYWLTMFAIALPIFFIIELEKYLTKRFGKTRV